MLYYLSDGMYSVFESQVLTPLQFVTKAGFGVTIINIDKNIGSNEYCQKVQKYKENTGIDIISFPRIHGGGIFEQFLLKKYIKSISNLIIFKQNSNQEPVIIHCRGQICSYIALKVKQRLKNYQIKVISDFRGVNIEEYKLFYTQRGKIYKSLMPFLLKRLDMIEKFVIQNTDHIMCVSYKLKEYILSRATPRSSITVIPTCLDIERFCFDPFCRIANRRKLGIEGRFVVVYNGGMNFWQMPEKMVQTFIHIKQQINSAFFLVLTTEKAFIDSYLKKYGVSNSDFLVTSCNYKEIKDYLCCGDLGLILRERNLINQVASPTKFAELLACYVPVLISRGVGDTETIIRQYHLGLFYEEMDDLPNALKQIVRTPEIYDQVVKQNYSWQENIFKLITVYGQLLNKDQTDGEYFNGETLGCNS
jgi:glycosyltransferase involved in cell wall biosynthesis